MKVGVKIIHSITPPLPSLPPSSLPPSLTHPLLCSPSLLPSLIVFYWVYSQEQSVLLFLSTLCVQSVWSNCVINVCDLTVCVIRDCDYCLCDLTEYAIAAWSYCLCDLTVSVITVCICCLTICTFVIGQSLCLLSDNLCVWCLKVRLSCNLLSWNLFAVLQCLMFLLYSLCLTTCVFVVW